MFFVVIFGLDLLCKLELCSEFRMDDFESLSEIFCGWYSRSLCDLWFKSRMKSVISKERGLFGGAILHIVECELSKR